MPVDAGRRSQREPRLPSDGVVRLLCPGRRGVQSGFLRDVSRGGMFLRLVDPEPAGTRLGFELSLPGRRDRVRGTGEVAWVRESYGGPGRPPGMAVRFLTLELAGARELTDLLGAPPRADVAIVEPTAAAAVDLEQMEAAVAGRGAGDPWTGGAEPAAAGGGAGGEGTAISARSTKAPEEDAPASETTGAAVASQLEGLVPLASSGASEAAPERAPAAAPRARRYLFLAAAVAVLLTAAAAWWSPWRRSAPAARDPAQRAIASADAGASASGAVSNVGPSSLPGSAAVDPVPDDPVADPAAPPEMEMASGGGAEAMPGMAAGPGLAARPQPPAPADAAAAARLVGVRWEPAPAGGTLLVLALDGPLAPSRLVTSRIGGESPRQLLELAGVRPGEARPGRWEVATDEVRGVRTGYHPDTAGGELHVVIDLAGADVVLGGVAIVGAELRCELVRR